MAFFHWLRIVSGRQAIRRADDGGSGGAYLDSRGGGNFGDLDNYRLNADGNNRLDRHRLLINLRGGGKLGELGQRKPVVVGRAPGPVIEADFAPRDGVANRLKIELPGFLSSRNG